jgi:putative transposase
MEYYRKGSHSIYDLKIHIVWITKYRKPVLFGDVAVRVRDLIREICKSQDVEILKGHVSKDHVHLFLSIPPQISVSKLVGRVKGKTSRKLLSENRRLSKQFWDRHLWARGYFAASSGNVTDDVIMQYIAMQDIQERAHDDDFTISP